MSKFGIAALALTATLAIGLFVVFNTGENADSDLTAGTTTPDTTLLSTTTTLTQTTATVVATTSTTAATTTTVTTIPTTAPTTSTTTSPTTPPSTSPSPVFSVTISTPTESELSASWRPGCPVPVEELRLLRMSHWGYDSKVRTGELVVAAGQVGGVSRVFQILFEQRFPIERMELVDNFGGDDDSSMAANNTSAFNCRQVTGGSAFSEHSYGRAIDINPLVNPYVNGSVVAPPGGAPYADRSLDAPGMIHGSDEVVRAFAGIGWTWGGNWTSLKDYQHFSSTGR